MNGVEIVHKKVQGELAVMPRWIHKNTCNKLGQSCFYDTGIPHVLQNKMLNICLLLYQSLTSLQKQKDAQSLVDLISGIITFLAHHKCLQILTKVTKTCIPP